MTKIDLEALGRRAHSASVALLSAGNDGSQMVDTETARFLTESPAVVIALITRLRKMEGSVERAVGCLQANSDKSARRKWADGLLDDLQEGTVLP